MTFHYYPDTHCDTEDGWKHTSYDAYVLIVCFIVFCSGTTEDKWSSSGFIVEKYKGLLDTIKNMKIYHSIKEIKAPQY